MIRGSIEPRSIEPPRRNSVHIPVLPNLDRLEQPPPPSPDINPRAARVAFEVLHDSVSEASLAIDGSFIPQGRPGVYLSLDPDPRFRLAILAPQRHKSAIRRGYVRLQMDPISVYLHVEEAARRLHWTPDEVKHLDKERRWTDRVRQRIGDVKRVVDETSRLNEKLLLTKTREGDGWDAGLSDEDLIVIVRRSEGLTPKSAQFYENSHGKFIFYKKQGSLRIFRADGNLHNREQSVVDCGSQIVGSPGRKVNKRVPRRLSGQVEGLENSYRILGLLHAGGNAKYIQAVPSTPRRMVALDGSEFSVQFCRMYNERDLLAVNEGNQRWKLLPMREKLEVCGHFIRGLAFLHQKRKHPATNADDQIRHGDIKADNLFVDSGETWRGETCQGATWQGVLGDFDGAQFLGDLRATLGLRARMLRGVRELDIESLRTMYDIATPDTLLLDDAVVQLQFLQQGDFDSFLRVELARDVWQLGGAIIEGLTGYCFGRPTKEGYPVTVDGDVLKWARAMLRPDDVPESERVPEGIVQVLLRMYDPDWQKRWPAAHVCDWYQTVFEHCFRKGC